MCDGVSIADNQRYITEVWLMKGGRVILLIDIVLILVINAFEDSLICFCFKYLYKCIYYVIRLPIHKQNCLEKNDAKLKKKMFPATYFAT